MKKILLFITLLTLSFVNGQNTLIVDNNVNVDTTPSHMHSTFLSAINAAANGDIIYVQPSETSYGSINITKQVTVYGIGHNPELNNGRRALFNSITISADNIKISGIEVNGNTVTAGGRENITLENNRLGSIYFNTQITNGIIQGNIIKNGTAIVLHANSIYNISLAITNNFFDGITLNGFQNFNSNTIFNNNVVIFRGVTTQNFFYLPNDHVSQNNIFISTNTFNGTNWQTGGTPILFNNCLSYSYTNTTIAALNGTGNFDNTNPQFSSIPGTNPIFDVLNDYNINSGLLGTDGNDIGIYNGYYDFDMRGYPTLLPYLEEMTISNNMIPSGTNLNVNIKANANISN